MKSISKQQLYKWPFKLGATFRLIAYELIDQGWTIELFEQNIERKWGYFFARKDDSRMVLISLKGEFFSELNSRTGYFFTINKRRSYEFAKKIGIEVPETLLIESDNKIALSTLHSSNLVVKPLNGQNGRGISLRIDANDEKSLQDAVTKAQNISPKVLVQEFVSGNDYRLLFLGGKFFAAVRRRPASVVGDGKNTVEELIAIRNNIPKSEDFQGTLTGINPETVRKLNGDTLLRLIPKQDEKIYVNDKANLSLGGDAIDVTESVHEDYRKGFEELVNILALNICGIDIIAENITQPMSAGYKLIEINSAPNIRPHTHPTSGKNRYPAQEISHLLINNLLTKT